eukprot:4044877-Alexandrium_andersonii.AAC.1
MCTFGGFVTATRFLLECLPGSLVWFAVVCSTWVFMSRSSTGRNVCVLGNGSACTKYANVMVHRVCLLCELASSCNVKWVIEQPTSSTMHRHPRFEQMLAKHKACGIATK